MWCACLFPAVAAMAEDVVIKAGDLRITYVENGKQFNVEYNAGSLPARIHESVPEATYDIHGKDGFRISSASCAEADYQKRTVNDAFGKGTCHTFVFSSPASGDDVTLRKSFTYMRDGITC